MKGHPSIRKLLQLVGTELGRDWLGPDTLWIDKFFDDLRVLELEAEDKGWDLIVVNDDCRFINEYRQLQDNGFLMVKLVRDERERVTSIKEALLRDNPSWVIESTDTDWTKTEKIVACGKAIEQIMAHPSETNLDGIIPDITVASQSVDQITNTVVPMYLKSTDKEFVEWGIFMQDHISTLEKNNERRTDSSVSQGGDEVESREQT